MKFSVKINGAPAGELEAANACDAVDEAREAHVAPDEGGDFELEVSSAAPWEDSAGKMHPAGVVCSTSFRVEPAEHCREAVEAAAREAEAAKVKAAEREALKAELLAEIAKENSK